MKSSEPRSRESGGRHARLSAWEANLAREQESHYSEEDGEHKEHVRGADHRVVGQLVRLPPHLVDVEAYGEDERRHAEQDHWEEGARQKTLASARVSTRNTRTICHVGSVSSCTLIQERQGEQTEGDQTSSGMFTAHIVDIYSMSSRIMLLMLAQLYKCQYF